VSQTTTSQIVVRSEDRRRHLRQKLCSITYLEFGDDNGGILLNLGGGGLSLQAVAKLNAGQELSLRFGLFNDEDPITIAGRVIWLSPTRKEAGICFVDLTESAAKDIDRWLAAQDAGRLAAEFAAGSTAKSEPAPNEIHLLPPHLSVVPPASKDILPDPQLASSGVIPNEARLGSSLLDHASNRAKTSPVFGSYVPTMMPARLVSHPKDQLASTAPSAPEEASDAKQPTIRLFRATPPPFKELRQLDQPGNVRIDTVTVEPALSAPPAQISTPNAVSIAKIKTELPSVPVSAQTENRRTIQIAAGAAACVGILLLLYMTANLGNPHVSNVTSSESVESSSTSSSPREAVNSGPSTGSSGGANVPTSAKPSGAQDTAPPQTKIPATAAAAAAVPNSTPTPPENAPQIVEQGSNSSWLEAFKQTFFGVQDKPKLDPAVARVSVWTDQRTGFYYCANSRYFVKPERVSLVTQGEALQSGFQPKLGTYCY
jgi:Tfp pilus assembly protein PilZ